jgi:class II lanthipeptide synthase
VIRDQFLRVVGCGLTLQERVRWHRTPAGTTDLDADQQNRLRLWRSWFQTEESWSIFIQSIKLSEKQLVRLRNADNTVARGVSWIAVLERLWVYLQGHDCKPSIRETIPETIASPIVNFAWRELSRRLQPLSVRLFSPRATAALRRSLLHRLMFTTAPILTWEMQSAVSDIKVAMTLKTKEEFHEYFLAGGPSRRLLKLFEVYPGLARLLAVQIAFWIQFTEDFACHAIDFARRRRVPWNDCYLIADLFPDISDPHIGNRTALRVKFFSSKQFVYKPRAGVCEIAWFALLDSLNHQGFPARFRILRVNGSGDHCWMEFARARKCRTLAQQKHFYFRAGALLYLTHLLHGIDFHSENVVAAQDQPLFVDCETLMHPEPFLPSVMRLQGHSILRTGLLPIGGDALEVSPRERATALSVKPPAPGFYIGPANVSRFLDQIVQGFREMHQFLRANADRIKRVNSLVIQLHELQARRVYRPSRQYYGLAKGSLSPSLLRNGVDKSVFLSASCLNGQSADSMTRREINALENLDIPVFYRVPPVVRLNISNEEAANSIRAIRRAFCHASSSRASVLPH